MSEIEFRYLQLITERNYNTDGISFYGTVRNPYRDTGFRVTGFEVEEYDLMSGGVWRPPAFWLTMDHAQELMDSLWNSGVRPTDMGDSVGALAATERHLEDLRRLYFEVVLGNKDNE